MGRAVTAADLLGPLSLTASDQNAVLSQKITSCLVCDILSDVLKHGRTGMVWITVQTHMNVIAAASLAGINCVIVAQGNRPEPQVLKKAAEEGIALFESPLDAFTLAGKLYELGLR